MSPRGETLSFLAITSLLWIGIGNMHAVGAGKVTSNHAKLCSCQKSCLPQIESDQAISVSSQPAYFFDTETSSCIELSLLCVANATCLFSSKAGCVASCGTADDNKPRGDGGAKSEDCKGGNKCSNDVHKTNVAPPPSGSSFETRVRWDLVATGLSVLVLLVAVLSVSGILAYHYKEKQRQRLRSRYIHNVLEMYESDDTESEISEGTGDPSVKDNASKGLFVKA